MKNKATSFAIVFVLILSNFVFFSFTKHCEADGPTYILVGDEQLYPTIQDGINHANEGDTVYVYNGTYRENIIVNKSINLVGEDRNTTIIDGTNSGIVVDIAVDWVNVSGFTITNCDSSTESAGINIHSNHTNIFDNNVINNNMNGIYSLYSSNNTISSNIVCYNFCKGIYLETSSFNTITSNYIYENSNEGIYFSYTSNSDISLNHIYKNSYFGIYLETSSFNTITSNYIYENSNDGIYFSYTSNNTVASNNIHNNYNYGIYFLGSVYNTISSNHIYYNSNTGIHIIQSSNNEITSNYVQNNFNYGISISASYPANNAVYNNYFDNLNNAEATGDINITWNTSKISSRNIVGGEWLGGNYWSNYKGCDINHDSIGDTLKPYNNNKAIQNSGDYLPLVISPGITSVAPTNESTNVSVSTNIIIFFDKSMNQTSVEHNINISPSIGINFDWSNNNKTLTVDPTSDLQNFTTYTVQINWNATDADANVLLSEYKWIFTTQQSDENNGNGAFNTAPIASTDGPYNGYVHQSITFYSIGSTDQDGDNLTYLWDFGDGITGVGIQPTHVYRTMGTFNVTLTVSDGVLTDSATTTAIISEPPEDIYFPVANANGPYTGLTFQNMLFKATNSYDPDGTILNYTWDFGDGTRGYGMQLIHCYNHSGLYNIILTVIDNDRFTNSNLTIANIILDSDADGLDDETETILKSNSKNKSDVIAIEIEGTIHYLIDTNRDNKSDIFYNIKTKKYTIIGITNDGLYIIDIDRDNKWDYVYNSINGVINIYRGELSDEFLWFFTLIGITSTIIISFVVIYWIYIHQKRRKS